MEDNGEPEIQGLNTEDFHLVFDQLEQLNRIPAHSLSSCIGH